MALESLLKKWPGHAARFVREQLGFNAVDSRRLLQSLDHVRKQPHFNFARVWKTAAIRHEKIADHTLAAFVNEETIAKDTAPFDRGIPGKDFRVDITQDHLRGSVVI